MCILQNHHYSCGCSFTVTDFRCPDALAAEDDDDNENNENNNLTTAAEQTKQSDVNDFSSQQIKIAAGGINFASASSNTGISTTAVDQTKQPNSNTSTMQQSTNTTTSTQTSQDNKPRPGNVSPKQHVTHHKAARLNPDPCPNCIEEYQRSRDWEFYWTLEDDVSGNEQPNGKEYLGP